MRETLRTIVRPRAGVAERTVHVTEAYRPGGVTRTLCGVRLPGAVGLHVIPAGYERCAECGHLMLESPDR